MKSKPDQPRWVHSRTFEMADDPRQSFFSTLTRLLAIGICGNFPTSGLMVCEDLPLEPAKEALN